MLELKALPKYIKQHLDSTELVYDILILLYVSLIVTIKEHLHVNSCGQAPQVSIQNTCTYTQPHTLQEVMVKHKSPGRGQEGVVRGGHTQIELTHLALNEDQPELYMKGQSAETPIISKPQAQNLH